MEGNGSKTIDVQILHRHRCFRRVVCSDVNFALRPLRVIAANQQEFSLRRGTAICIFDGVESEKRTAATPSLYAHRVETHVSRIVELPITGEGWCAGAGIAFSSEDQYLTVGHLHRLVTEAWCIYCRSFTIGGGNDCEFHDFGKHHIRRLALVTFIEYGS